MMRFLVLGFFVLSFAFINVNAQPVIYVCPEGTYQSVVFGIVECIPFERGGSQKKESRPEAPNIGSMALGVTMMGSKVLNDLARVVKDPKSKGYFEGEWFFDEPANGESCSATFTRRGVGVTVLGPSKRLPGTFLIFYGPEIPAPAALGKNKFTLTQTGEKPQTVEAFNSAFPTVDGYGAVIFQVPTIDAALDGIEDVHKFGIANNKSILAEVEWTAGLAARDRLRKCVGVRKLSL